MGARSLSCHTCEHRGAQKLYAHFNVKNIAIKAVLLDLYRHERAAVSQVSRSRRGASAVGRRLDLKKKKKAIDDQVGPLCMVNMKLVPVSQPSHAQSLKSFNPAQELENHIQRMFIATNLHHCNQNTVYNHTSSRTISQLNDILKPLQMFFEAVFVQLVLSITEQSAKPTAFLYLITPKRKKTHRTCFSFDGQQFQSDDKIMKIHFWHASFSCDFYFFILFFSWSLSDLVVGHGAHVWSDSAVGLHSGSLCV